MRTSFLGKRRVLAVAGIVAMATVSLVASPTGASSNSDAAKAASEAAKAKAAQKAGGWADPQGTASAKTRLVGVGTKSDKGGDAGQSAALAPTASPTLVNDPNLDTVNPTRDTQSETTIARTGGNTMVAAYNDSNSFNTGAHFTGWSTSADNGNTWIDKGALPVSADGDAGDPTLAYSAKTGSTFLATLGFNSGDTIQVFKSTNNGATFGAPLNAFPDATARDIDKEWLTADNVVGGAGSGYGNLYMFARDFGACDCILFSRSTDDGVTWGGIQTLAAAVPLQGTYVAVGPDHSVYAFWLEGAGNVIMMRKSTNLGVTFAPAVVVADEVGSNVNGAVNVAGGFRTNGFPHAAVNPINGHLYLVYNDVGTTAGDVADIFYVKSTNGGTTWSAPVRVNNDTGIKDQFMPTIAVSPDGTKLLFSWYDRRGDDFNQQIQRFAQLAGISGGTVSLGKNFPMSPFFPVVVNQDALVNNTYMGDYDVATMAASGNFVFTWGDNRDSNTVHTHQPDIRRGVLAQAPIAGDLSVVGSVSPASPGVAQFTTFTFDVGRVGGVGTLGNAFASVRIATPNFLVTAITTTKGSCSATDRNVSCALNNFTPGDTAQVKVKGYPLATGSLQAVGRVAHPGLDSVVGNDAATVTTTVVPGGTNTTISSDSDCAILDVATVECLLPVPAGANVVKAEPFFRLDHTFDSDLVISLVHPDGSVVLLSNQRGGAGDNYGTGPNPCDNTSVYTTFSDSAATPITAGTAPFAGTFKPEGSLSSLAGKPRAGTWKLRITDSAAADIGTLYCWGVKILSP